MIHLHPSHQTHIRKFASLDHEMKRRWDLKAKVFGTTQEMAGNN